MKVIAIEGIDGTGKTTLWNNLQDRLPSYIHFMTSPDPEGPLREVIRERIHSEKRNAIEEGYLFAADRVIQYNRLKEAGIDWVITDRSTLSSLAYQGASCTPAERGFIQTLFSKVPMFPDFVIYLDAEADDPRILERLKSRGTIDGMENTEYQKAVAQEYKSLLPIGPYCKLSPFEEMPMTTAIIAERKIRDFIASTLTTQVNVRNVPDGALTHDLLAWGPELDVGTIGKANVEALTDICIDTLTPMILSVDYLHNTALHFYMENLHPKKQEMITGIINRLDDYPLINEDVLSRVEQEILDEYVPDLIGEFYYEVSKEFDERQDLTYDYYPWLWHTATDWCFNMGYEWHKLVPSVPKSEWRDAVNMAANMFEFYDTHKNVKIGEYIYVQDTHGWWRVDQFEMRPACVVVGTLTNDMVEIDKDIYLAEATPEETEFINQGVKAFM